MSTRRCEHPEQTPALPRRRQPIAFLAALWWTLLAGLAAPALAGADFAPRAGIAVETTLPVFDRINGQYAVYANLRNDSPEPLTGPTRLVVAQSSLAVRNTQGTTAAGELSKVGHEVNGIAAAKRATPVALIDHWVRVMLWDVVMRCSRSPRRNLAYDFRHIPHVLRQQRNLVG